MTFDADRAEYVGANQAKANFRGAYDAAGPAEYLTALAALDYRIPDEAAESVLELAEQLRRERGLDRVTVLDVGCSYGINAAVLSYRTTFRALSERYHGRDLDESADPAIADRHFFAQCERDSRVDVIGLDIASNAVRYGVRAGLLSEGVVENLEEEKLSPQGA